MPIHAACSSPSILSTASSTTPLLAHAPASASLVSGMHAQPRRQRRGLPPPPPLCRLLPVHSVHGVHSVHNSLFLMRSPPQAWPQPDTRTPPTAASAAARPAARRGCGIPRRCAFICANTARAKWPNRSAGSAGGVNNGEMLRQSAGTLWRPLVPVMFEMRRRGSSRCGRGSRRYSGGSGGSGGARCTRSSPSQLCRHQENPRSTLAVLQAGCDTGNKRVAVHKAHARAELAVVTSIARAA